VVTNLHALHLIARQLQPATLNEDPREDEELEVLIAQVSSAEFSCTARSLDIGCRAFFNTVRAPWPPSRSKHPNSPVIDLHFKTMLSMLACLSQAVYRHRNVSSNATACTQTHTWHFSPGIKPMGCSECSSLGTRCHRQVIDAMAA
jgi:hypothetical protein